MRSSIVRDQWTPSVESELRERGILTPSPRPSSPPLIVPLIASPAPENASKRPLEFTTCSAHGIQTAIQRAVFTLSESRGLVQLRYLGLKLDAVEKVSLFRKLRREVGEEEPTGIDSVSSRRHLECSCLCGCRK